MSDQLVQTTKTYYDSTDADEFYHTIWGGEDIHVGLYEYHGESILKASNRTVRTMAEKISPIGPETRILDLGAGYGGAARYLAATFGCHVDCLNLSDAENRRNKEKNKQADLSHLITVTGGNFEDVPFEDESYDIVWSEDAFLHSGQKAKIFAEIKRVLRPGGQLIFTDPMQADNCPSDVLGPILQRIHLEALGSVKKYRLFAQQNGLEEVAIIEMPEQLTNHYQSVLDQMNSRHDELADVCSDEYVTNMKKGLQHWINGGKKNYLNWGIMHFKKP